jgi:hypothetical protein
MDPEEKTQIIMRQTDYTYEVSKIQLEKHNYDVITVIREYLKQGITPIEPLTKPLSMNQQIYKEIRTFLNETNDKKVNDDKSVNDVNHDKKVNDVNHDKKVNDVNHDKKVNDTTY